MNLSVFPVFAATAATLLFAACEGDQPTSSASTRRGGFHPPVPTPTPAAANPDARLHDPAPAQNAETGNPSSHSAEIPKTTADTKPRNPVPDAPTSTGNPPYARPVPGKAGFVTNPFDASKGYIDVRGFPPGTEVKDPSTGKTFLVP